MRIRITFAKTEALRYTGHLDLQRVWERTMRRSGLPLAYSQGFHATGRIQLACALPLGFTSSCERVDIWLEAERSPDMIKSALESAVPPGIDILAVDIVGDNQPPLQTRVTSAEYLITLLEPIPAEELEAIVERLKSASVLPRQRRGKDYDLRPLIENLTMLNPDEQGLARLHAQLSAREGATGRPEEVLDAMGIPAFTARVQRVRLLF